MMEVITEEEKNRVAQEKYLAESSGSLFKLIRQQEASKKEDNENQDDKEEKDADRDVVMKDEDSS